MTKTESDVVPGAVQVYENLFGTETRTGAILFATSHPFSAGSGGHNLYQVSVLKNGQWVTEPVGVRWADMSKRLVVGLHAGGPISGVRLYHMGDSTGLRKPTLINANPPAELPHAEEVSLPEEAHDVMKTPSRTNHGSLKKMSEAMAAFTTPSDAGAVSDTPTAAGNTGHIVARSGQGNGADNAHAGAFGGHRAGGGFHY